jgi:hypothetical protein
MSMPLAGAVRESLEIGFVRCQKVLVLSLRLIPAQEDIAAYFTDDEIQDATSARTRDPMRRMHSSNCRPMRLGRLLAGYPVHSRIGAERITTNPEILEVVEEEMAANLLWRAPGPRLLRYAQRQ